jgi:hypothetical protein
MTSSPARKFPWMNEDAYVSRGASMHLGAVRHVSILRRVVVDVFCTPWWTWSHRRVTR